jgi:hypothetical protein
LQVYDQLKTAGKGVSAWWCKGWRDMPDETGASDHWHMTSTEINEASFPELQCVLTGPPRFAYAVSFHRCSACTWDSVDRTVIIGGLADHDAVKVMILDAIRNIPGISTNPVDDIVIATSGDLAAQEETNLTNRLATGNQGVQIEQRLDVRQSHGQLIATAVASVFADLISVGRAPGHISDTTPR